MLSQMEDVDILNTMMMVRWVLLICMEAWTIQLFLCLTSSGSTHAERADEAPFSFGFKRLWAWTRTDNIRHSMTSTKSRSSLGWKLWPVSLLIFLWPRRSQIKQMLVKFHKSLRVVFVLGHKTSVLNQQPHQCTELKQHYWIKQQKVN